MTVTLCTLSDENIRKVLADPPLVWKAIAPDEPEFYEEARGGKPGLLARLFGSKPRPVVDDLSMEEGDRIEVDLDKAWHGIHYLLTQRADAGAPPLDFLVAGGAPAGDVDVGYGPARLFTSKEIGAIRRAIEPIDETTLRHRFDPAEMTRLEIYPSVIWERDDADESIGYCVENFEILKRFLGDAAARNLGAIIHMS